MSGASLRFEANLSILFTELPLLERPRAAAACGFRAAELWWPFSQPVASGAEEDALAESLGEAGLALVGLNLDGGDLAAGERGLVSLPGMDARFEDNLASAMAFALRCGTPAVNALYGNRVEGASPEQQDELALQRLVKAARAGAAAGVRILIETQNRVDSPRYPLTTAEQAVGVAAKVREASGQENVDWLCDLYHLAMEDQDLVGALEAYADWIGHVQVADAPGRHQPGTGSIDFPGVLSRLAELGYEGWVGAEYRPSGPSADSFGWRPALEQVASTRARGSERGSGR